MGKKKRNKSKGMGLPGKGEGAGASFHPGNLPEEEATKAAPEAGAVPLGLPISVEEYERLQREARHKHLPSADNGQEDSSASSDDG